MQKGDTVRFLNDVGGGKITRIDGKTAYVEDQDGFETPVLVSELVVVMPVEQEHGLTSEKSGRANLMFDQKAFDAGRKVVEQTVEKVVVKPEIPVEETVHGDAMNVVLAFEPTDIKHLSQSRFSLIMVNDSNYYISYILSARADNQSAWKLVAEGVMEPNIEDDLARIAYEDLNDFAQIAFQCIAYKRDKSFELKSPLSSLRKLDLSKFYKMHCFREGKYFDTPVLELPMIVNDAAHNPLQVDEVELAEAMGVRSGNPKTKILTHQLTDKYRKDISREKTKNNKRPEDNPNKLLHPLEVDLHIGELTDTTAGMSNADMLELQLRTVRNTMQQHRRRKGQKIVFIHGKGEGVLRKAVLDLLKREYPSAELQDASFREYGFGATSVTIH